MTAQGRARAAQTVAGGALLITLVTIVSRVFGLGRWAVQASEVGSTGVGEAYAVANLLPNVLFEVVAGGALAGAIVPVAAGAIARRAHLDVSRSASAMLTWTLAALVPVGLLVALLAPQIVAVLPRVGDPALHDVSVLLLRVFSIQVPLYGVSVVAAGILQAHRRFFWPSAAPILSTVVVIASYLVFGALADGHQTSPEMLSSASLAWLAWGSTAGVVALSLPLLIPVHRAGVRLRLTFSFPPGEAARARSLAFAGIGALLAQQASVVVLLLVANSHGEGGAYPVFQYAQAVYLLPYAVLAVPLATSAFPHLTEHAATGDGDRFGRLAAVSVRGVAIVSVAGAALLVAAAGPIEAFFGFTTGGAAHMATAITWLAPGAVGLALVFHVSRILYATNHARAAVTAASCGWLVVAVGSAVGAWVLVTGHDTDAVFRVMGGASSLGMTVGAVLLLRAVREHLGPAPLVGVGRTIGITLVTAAGVCVVLRRLAGSLAPSGAGTWQGAWVALLVGAAALAVVLVVGFLVDRAALRGLVGGEAHG